MVFDREFDYVLSDVVPSIRCVYKIYGRFIGFGISRKCKRLDMKNIFEACKCWSCGTISLLASIDLIGWRKHHVFDLPFAISSLSNGVRMYGVAFYITQIGRVRHVKPTQTCIRFSLSVWRKNRKYYEIDWANFTCYQLNCSRCLRSW